MDNVCPTAAPQLIGKYRVLEELGRGGMGTVYKVQDTFLGRFAALKLIAEKYRNDQEAMGRFEREGQTAATLQHPNICAVYETGRWQDLPYIVMELLEGKTLSERIGLGPIGGDQLLRIGIPIVSALEAAHRMGIVHRDIKPANLFVTRSGQMKVLDFGLAKTKRLFSAPVTDDMPTAAMFVTMPGVILGTFAYMSPEQVRGEPVDGRADIYSLGVVFYELLTGKLPVVGISLAPLPRGLSAIIAKMIAPDRNHRFLNATELRQALQDLRDAG